MVILITVLSIMIILFLFLGIPRLLTEILSNRKIFTVDQAPETSVAIVFGAGLRSDGSVTTVLRDRVDTAASLYFAGKVQKILMSGDNRFENYNEPAAMFNHAIALGVPAEDIVLDYAGRRSYDTCYRAKEIFGVEQAILVTQRFHLPRALFLCNQMGIESVGVSANMSYYRKVARLIWNVRELPATFVSMVDVWFRHPVPVLGPREPIFPQS